MKTLFSNRQARHEYLIKDTFKAGLILEGWEVKALQASQATFNGGSAYIKVRDGEVWLEGFTITPLAHTVKGLLVKPNPTRARKLLLNKTEIKKLQTGATLKGFTVVPLEVAQERKIKIIIALAKGKQLHDKRDAVKRRDIERALQRDFKSL